MSRTIEVAVPHRLGRDEARRRLRARIGELPDHLPGGARVTQSWTGEDELALVVAAMGQEVAGRIAVRDTAIDVTIDLPGMLALFAEPIRQGIARKGGALLLEDGTRKDG